MDIREQLTNESDGKVELVVDSVTDEEVTWKEVDGTTPKSDLNDDLPPLSEGSIVELDTATGNFTLIS